MGSAQLPSFFIFPSSLALTFVPLGRYPLSPGLRAHDCDKTSFRRSCGSPSRFAGMFNLPVFALLFAVVWTRSCLRLQLAVSVAATLFFAPQFAVVVAMMATPGAKNKALKTQYANAMEGSANPLKTI